MNLFFFSVLSEPKVPLHVFFFFRSAWARVFVCLGLYLNTLFLGGEVRFQCVYMYMMCINVYICLVHIGVGIQHACITFGYDWWKYNIYNTCRKSLVSFFLYQKKTTTKNRWKRQMINHNSTALCWASILMRLAHCFQTNDFSSFNPKLWQNRQLQHQHINFSQQNKSVTVLIFYKLNWHQDESFSILICTSFFFGNISKKEKETICHHFSKLLIFHCPLDGFYLNFFYRIGLDMYNL